MGAPVVRADDPSRTPLDEAAPPAARRFYETCSASLHPEERIYTFWKYFRNAFTRDVGLRIDHLLLNAAASRRLIAAGIDRDVRAWESASDHAPIWIELADQAGGDRIARRTSRRSP